MKEVLFIEDYFTDFNEFSNIFIKNGFNVYPSLTKIKNQKELTQFLGKDFEIDSYQDFNLLVLSHIIKKLFLYINENALYSKLSLIILDISLFDKDTIGLDLLREFRSEFEPLDPKYKEWNKTIPIIALTSYSTDKYKMEFVNHSGYLLGFHNKEVCRHEIAPLIADMNNFHEQMSAIYPLFYDIELKHILNRINNHEKELLEIKQIARLILISEIAQLDPTKRNIFIDNFASELIRYINHINGFMVDVEMAETQMKNDIRKIFDSPPVKITSLISSLYSITNNIIKPESAPDFINKFMATLADALGNQIFDM